MFLYLVKKILFDFSKCLVVMIINSSQLLAQNNADRESIEITDSVIQCYFYEPFPQKTGTSVIQIGGSFTVLPVVLAENEYPVPAVDLQYKYGLLEKTSFVASFSTNYFGNLLHTGFQWNTNAGNFSFGIANHLGGFYGFIHVEGQFDKNSAYAIYYLPIIRIGHRFNDFSVSMSWSVSYIFKSSINVSGLKAAGPQGKVNDIFCTIAVEQPFLKKAQLSIGFSLTYARSPYQSWLLYNTIDHYLFVPEFFFAVQL